MASKQNVPVSLSVDQTHNASASTNSSVSTAARNRKLPSWMLMKSDKKSSEKKDTLIQG